MQTEIQGVHFFAAIRGRTARPPRYGCCRAAAGDVARPRPPTFGALRRLDARPCRPAASEGADPVTDDEVLQGGSRRAAKTRARVLVLNGTADEVLQGRAFSAILGLIERRVDLWASERPPGGQMDSGRFPELSRSLPSCLNRRAQRTDFVHGLLRLNLLR